MSEPANPYAFPTDHSGSEEYTNIQGGLTMRDYFAAQALAGFCAHLALDAADGPIWNPEGVAIRVYELADAMLQERTKA